MTLFFAALVIASAAQAAPAPQAPAAAPAASAGPGQAVQAPVPPAATAEAETYSYNPEGRRDPFVSLVGRGSEPSSTRVRTPGPGGLLVSEITVKGIIRDRNGFLAMIQSPDSRTYIVRSGDKVMDGGVKAITADGVVFAQDVNDPLSVVKQREVPKRVRAADAR